MTPVSSNGSPLHAESELVESARIRGEIARRFHVRKYERPNDPVGLEDWDTLAD